MTYKEKLMKDYPECVSEVYMGGCKYCPDNYYCGAEPSNRCDHGGSEEICAECWNREAPAPAPKTNGERIRAMSDEELAWMLVFFRDDWDDYETPDCHFFDTEEEAIAHTVEWLKQPAEEGAE